MNNTEIWCLKSIVRRGIATPGMLAVERWPNTAQLDKKRKTIRQHCDSLVRAGYLRRLSGVYIPNDAGRQPAEKAMESDRPAMMRIVKT